MESIHKGHRERLRYRFSEFGLDSFSDIEALEMLLFYALPRRNTNELAHALLRNFGSFCAVMEAQTDDLTQVEGIGKNAAYLIRLVAEFGRRYMLSERNPGKPLKSRDDAGRYVLPLFTYETGERVYVLCLDDKGVVQKCKMIASGMANRVDFTYRDIVDVAMRCDCCRVIMAHNHPSGTALPSAADISVTRQLKISLGTIGVKLEDHIIVSGGDYVSLKDSGYI